MINAYIQRLALELLVGAIRDPDPGVRAQRADAFWDLQYWHRFGLPELPPASTLPQPWPPEPQPDPSPLDRLDLTVRQHNVILMSLIESIAIDPDPQPVTGDPDPQPNLRGVLGSSKRRLAAAKRAAERLAAGLARLEGEIERLREGA